MSKLEQHPELLQIVTDADINGFFDNVCHERLEELLRKRVSNPKLLSLIRRFLKAGVMIDGRRKGPRKGFRKEPVFPAARQCILALRTGRMARA